MTKYLPWITLVVLLGLLPVSWFYSGGNWGFAGILAIAGLIIPCVTVEEPNHAEWCLVGCILIVLPLSIMTGYELITNPTEFLYGILQG